MKIRRSSGLSLNEYLESMEIFIKTYVAMESKEWEKAIKEDAIAALDMALELDPRYEPAIINREAISSLSEGEKLAVSKFKSIDYYKDFTIKKKSLIDKF